MESKVWVVVEYIMFEYCCIVGIFETEQEAIDMQAQGINDRADKDYFLSRHHVSFGEVSAKALVRDGR